MKINPEIKTALSVIAKASVKYHNETTSHTRYIRRLLKVFDNHLTEEERIYVIFAIAELVHYRNLAVDPDNMVTISNIKLRSTFFVFLSTIVVLVIAVVLFSSRNGLNDILPMLLHFFKIFSI